MLTVSLLTPICMLNMYKKSYTMGLHGSCPVLLLERD